MIVLDTHIWIWWVHGDDRLRPKQAEVIKANEADTIGISAISFWEVAKLVEYDRLTLPYPIVSASPAQTASVPAFASEDSGLRSMLYSRVRERITAEIAAVDPPTPQ